MPASDASGLRPAPALRPEHVTAAVETVLGRRRQVAVHLLVYAVVNAVLVLVWLGAGFATGSWFPWPLLPLAVWGLGLQLHWWWAYGPLNRIVREEVLVRGNRPAGRP